MRPRANGYVHLRRRGHAGVGASQKVSRARPTIVRAINGPVGRLGGPGVKCLRLLASAVALGLAVATSSAAQTGSAGEGSLRRGSPIQPVSQIKKGDLLVGVGVAFESAIDVPLLAAHGDLRRLGVAELAYAVADGVLLEIRGDVHRVLKIDAAAGATSGPVDANIVQLDADLADGTATGSGDFGVGILFRLIGGDEGLSVGGRFQFNIPSSDEDQGLGTNSLATRMSVLGSYGRGPLRLTGDLGVGILEAPVENFEQNDVVVYSAELLYSPLRDYPLRLFASVSGRASTRNRVPLGTEDTGQLNLGAERRVGRWLLDAFGMIGYAGISPDWGFGGGVAFLLADRP